LEENWKGRIDKIKRLISVWEKRNLSIMGKACLIKTFMISQLVYVMQALIIPENTLLEINRLLFRFLWRKKDCNRKAFEKVKRSTICSKIENGGLSMIDIKQMQKEILLHWIFRLSKATCEERWRYIPEQNYNIFGDKYLCFYSNVKANKFKGLNLIKSCFWGQVLHNWLELNNHLTDIAPSRIIWNNNDLKYQDNVLFFPEWINGNIVYIKDVIAVNGEIITFPDLCNILQIEF